MLRIRLDWLRISVSQGSGTFKVEIQCNDNAFPTEEPTENPTEEPTADPTENPSEEPTEEPTADPSEHPTEEPTEDPTEEPTDQPTPHHASSARISHAIVERTCETWQKTQHRKRYAEGRPQRELSLEFLLVTECYQRRLVCAEPFEIRRVAIGKDGRDRGFAGVGFRMAFAAVAALDGLE